MIATILPGSTDFHAVGYNERKVSKGTARLVEMQNFGVLGTFGKPTPDELVKYLQEYNSRNNRIKKAQFHVAISCKGHEMTESELLDFAHRYLSEMGYMQPGQPILVYSHHDTDNAHLHIVTSRIAPDGTKIPHAHERRRSQKAIDRLLGNDRKQMTKNAIDAAKEYTFSSFAQFKAVMASLGYEAYQKDGTVYVKHGGTVRQKMPLEKIEALYANGYMNRARSRQQRRILLKYRDVSADKEELKKELKEKFGIDIVFFGRKDKPFGYMLVNHTDKTVTNGARVLGVEELLDFATPEERFNRMEAFIDRLLTLNPKITQGEIYKKLRGQHAYIKKGVIYFKGASRPLKPFMAEALDRNNHIQWVEMFKPSNEAERDVLCQIFKVSRTDLVDLFQDRPAGYGEAVERLRRLSGDETVTSIRSAFHEEGFVIRETDSTAYAIDFQKHIIIDLGNEGFDLERLKRNHSRKQGKIQKSHVTSGKGLPHIKLRDAGGGSQSEKREWEVGHKGNYDDIDDGQGMKR